MGDAGAVFTPVFAELWANGLEGRKDRGMRKIRSNRQNWRVELLIVYDMLVREEAGVAADYLMHLLFEARHGYRRVLGTDRG